MPKSASPLKAIVKALGFAPPIGESHKEQFQYAMKTAHAVAERQPCALADLVRLLAPKRMAASALFNEHVNPRYFPEDTTMVKQCWFDPWQPGNAPN